LPWNPTAARSAPRHHPNSSFPISCDRVEARAAAHDLFAILRRRALNGHRRSQRAEVDLLVRDVLPLLARSRGIVRQDAGGVYGADREGADE
jgi:hypothetical protein